jgi:sterol carrier protein 2
MIGPLTNKWPKHISPLDKGYMMMVEKRGSHATDMKLTAGYDKGPPTAQIFGNAGLEYMEKYGAKPEHFAEIARVNHAHRQPPPTPRLSDI